jgi:MFS family permease
MLQLPVPGRPRSRDDAWLEVVESDVPARLDALSWSRWHTMVLVALGSIWIIEGLQVTVAGTLGAKIISEHSLGLSSTGVGVAASLYLVGAVAGALVFGYLNDRLGPKRVFLITVSIYLLATLATATSFNVWTFVIFRCAAGFGIGGEYAAINAVIGELVPPRVRGYAYLLVNGSWWLGATLGAALSIVLLDPDVLPHDVGWRVALGVAGVIGLAIIALRRLVPESPRWLMVHGHAHHAADVVEGLERRHGGGEAANRSRIAIRQRDSIGFDVLFRALVRRHPRETVLAFSLMVAQAFFFNAVFFTYPLVLTEFYGVVDNHVGAYLIPMAVAAFMGPLLLGPLFDRVGRTRMISTCYVLAAVLLVPAGWLFTNENLSPWVVSAAWSAVFFVGSAGAAGAYLTISEVFPLELRGMAVAFFYASATMVGGFGAPALFGYLVDAGSRHNLYIGYVGAAVLMLAAAVVDMALGVRAERRPLEEVAPPLGADAAAASAPLRTAQPATAMNQPTIAP